MTQFNIHHLHIPAGTAVDLGSPVGFSPGMVNGRLFSCVLKVRNIKIAYLRHAILSPLFATPRLKPRATKISSRSGLKDTRDLKGKEKSK